MVALSESKQYWNTEKVQYYTTLFIPVSEILKEYSVILTTYFYGMNQKIQTKKLISKISGDYNFSFLSYA